MDGLGGLTNIIDTNHLISTGFIIPGDTSSRLLSSIESGRMPPSGAMSAIDQKIISDWIIILGGGNADGSSPVSVDLEMDITPSLDPLFFQVRLGKVASSLNVPESHTSLNTLQTNRFMLGDYNFAQAIAPNSNWESSDMVRWLENLQPACVGTRPTTPWPEGGTNLMTRTYGRTISSADSMILNEIDNLNITSNEKYEILCLVLLSSLEFVTK